MIKENQIWIVLKPEILIESSLVTLLTKELAKAGFEVDQKIKANNWERVAFQLYEHSDVLIPEHLDLLLTAGHLLMGDNFDNYQIWTLKNNDNTADKKELYKRLNDFKKVFRILVMSKGYHVKISKEVLGQVRDYYRTYIHVADPKLKIINDEAQIFDKLPLKYILFDGYGTLFDAGKENIWDLSLKISLKYGNIAQQVYSLWTKEYLSREAMFDDKFATIIETNRQALKVVFKTLKLPLDEVDDWINQLSIKWEQPQLLPSVKKLIAFYKKKHYRLGIISNIDEVTLEQAVKYLKLDVDYTLTSERAKCYKPNPAIFELAMKELKINNDECIYIGNSLVDVIGANAANIKVIHYNHEKLKLKKNYQLLAEIKKINELFDFDF